MSHFAKVEDEIVVAVIVAEQDFIATLPGQWVQTSYNTNANVHALGGTPLRGNYAGIGYTYDSTNDVFYPPRPYASWNLDRNWKWQPPVAPPEDAMAYTWDEPTLTWVPRTQ